MCTSLLFSNQFLILHSITQYFIENFSPTDPLPLHYIQTGIMASKKQSITETQVVIDSITDNHVVSNAPKMIGTTNDQKDLYRMGKVKLLGVSCSRKR